MEDALGWALVFAAVVSGALSWPKVHRPALAGPIAIVILGVALLFVAANARSTFHLWMQEDGWAEWATVFGFLVGAVVLFRRAARQRATIAPLATLALVLLALFCVFVAGEEISWGQRLLAFKPPDIFLEENFQQEFNVHNLLKGKELGALKLDSRFLVAIIAVGLATIYPWCVGLVKDRTWAKGLELSTPENAVRPLLLLIAGLELIYPFGLVGELAEMLLGLVMAIGFLDEMKADEAQPDAAASSMWRPPALIAGSLVLGLITAPLLFRIAYGADEESAAQAKAELQKLASDIARADVTQPRLFKKKSVHKRMFTATRSGYFAFGPDNLFLDGALSPAQSKGGRRDRLGYFLDPWNNPYWVHFKRKRGTVVLYSFGPNRRRDSNFKRSPKAKGDDITIEVTLER